MATVFSGGVYVNTTFTGALRSDIQLNIKNQLINAGWTNVAQAASQGPGNVGTVTISIASPGVITWGAAHGFLGGERIILQTTGALPSGLAVNTVYFVKFVDATTHRLATSLGGSDINTSGSQSGVHTLNTQYMLLQSATQTNVTNPIRVRLLDLLQPTIRVCVESQSGTIKSSNQANSDWGGQLLPAAAKTFRIIATQYHFLCFTPGVSASREFVMAGMPWVPPLLAGVTDIGYMFCNASSASDVTTRSNIRTLPTLAGSALGTSNIECVYNSNFLESQNTTSVYGTTGYPALLFVSAGDVQQLGRVSHYRWANDNFDGSDVLVSWGLTSTADEGKIKGQLYDIVFIPEAFAADATDTINGHNVWNITSNYAGNPTLTVRGGMWMATS